MSWVFSNGEGDRGFNPRSKSYQRFKKGDIKYHFWKKEPSGCPRLQSPLFTDMVPSFPILTWGRKQINKEKYIFMYITNVFYFVFIISRRKIKKLRRRGAKPILSLLTHDLFEAKRGRKKEKKKRKKKRRRQEMELQINPFPLFTHLS